MPNEFQSRSELMENVLERIKEMYASALRNAPVRQVREGFVDSDPDAPGKYCLTVATNTGISRYAGAELVEDNQVELSAALAPENSLLEPRSTPQAWDVLRNPHSDLEAKTRALDELSDQCSEEVARFAADELGRNDLPEAWRERLVFAVEDIATTDAEIRQRLRERLIEIARTIRESRQRASSGSSGLRSDGPSR